MPDPTPEERDAKFLEAVNRLKQKQATQEPAKGNPGDAKALAVHDVPCVCTCGKRWQGVAFTPLAQGEKERPRLCDDCGDKVEQRLTERRMADRRAGAPQGSYREATPPRVPYKDD